MGQCQSKNESVRNFEELSVAKDSNSITVSTPERSRKSLDDISHLTPQQQSSIIINNKEKQKKRGSNGHPQSTSSNHKKRSSPMKNPAARLIVESSKPSANTPFLSLLKRNKTSKNTTRDNLNDFTSLYNVQHNSAVPREWAMLCKRFMPQLVSPIDVPTAIDRRISSVVDQMRPTEIESIKRCVKQIIVSLKRAPNNGNGVVSLGVGSTSLSINLNGSSNNYLSSNGPPPIKEKSKLLLLKDNLIDESIFRKILSGGGYALRKGWEMNRPWLRKREEFFHQILASEDLSENEKADLMEEAREIRSMIRDVHQGNGNSDRRNSSTWRVGRDKASSSDSTDLSDPMASAFLLLLSLSKSRCESFASAAQKELERGGLKTDDSGVVTDRIPHVIDAPVVDSSSGDFDTGVTFESICFLSAIALHGTREQKISILFHVLLPPKYLKEILSRHIIPTWLIEESSDLIISLSSIYYHYRTKSECVLSQIQACDTLAILFCGGEYYEKPISKKKKPNKPTSPTKTRENNKTSNNENINNIAHQSEESFSNDHCLKYSYSSKYALEHLLSHVREGIYREPYPIEPLFWEGIQKTFDSYSSQSKNTWSILDFSEWADVYMNDSVLDTILHRLFGSGIFPSQRSERKLVADRWLRWEKNYMKRQQVHKNSFSFGNGVHQEQLFNDLDLMTNHKKSHKRNASLDSFSKNLPQSRDTKKSLFSKIFNNGNTNHEEPTMNGSTHSIDLSGQTTRPKVWGGLGGVDGRGGLGQGVLYLIDKSWWDKWSRYVGWDWTFDEERAGELSSEPYLNPYPEGPLSPPPSISNETLVDHSADSPPSGTFGSYYFVHTDLVRNDDFVLVPPGVWDILFLVYGGGPPLPRMVVPQEIPTPFITHESDNTNRELEAPENIKKQSSFITSSMEHGVEIEFQASNEDNSTSGVHPIPDNIIIETHPWVVHCLICNPNNPDNGGNVGHMSIRLMCTPKQPLWRLFSEILERLPMHYPHSRDSNGRGRARLWKRIGTKNSNIIGAKATSTKNNGSSSNVVSKNGNKSGSTKTTKATVRDVSTSTWSLLFGDRYAPFEVISNNKNGAMDSNNYPQQRNLEAAWKEYTNNATVESSGLCFGSFIMFEYAKVSENNVFSWPREAAEKEDQELRIAEEEKAFRYLLRGLQDNGKSRDALPKLKGMIIDAMDSSRRWYEAEIIQYDYTPPDDKTTTKNEKEENNNDSDEVIETTKRDDREEHEDECKNAIDNTREEIPEQQQIINQQLQSNDTASAEEVTRILVRFLNDQNLPDDTVEWIPVISNRLATRGRHTSNGCQNSVKTDATATSDSSDPNVTGGVNPTPTSNANSSSKPPSDSKSTKAVNSNGNGNSSSNNNANAVTVSGYTKPKMCPYPGYGACGLLNLGNTCYANAALQCVGYMPLLRSYLLSGTYKLDINKENPLGTGGRLLEEFADLLKLIWSAKDSSRAPSKFRQQLAKSNFQFSTSEQQDTQELLLAMLDSFHEDCNKIRKKPMVPPLDDKWVESTPISRVGREAWWRYLRRNKSVITNIAMGQVLNRVDCPSCSHSSLNFDPFGILSIPFPTINEVVFRCMVLRRGSARNCPDVLDRRNKYSQQQHHHKHGKGTSHPKSPSKFNTSNSSTVVHTPPSDNLVFEEYIISISRLADIGDLKLRLQNLTGIPKSRLKLCTSEDADSNTVSTFINNDNKNSDARLKIPPQTSIRPLPEKQGPCLQLVNQEQSPAQLQSSPVDSEDKITNIFVFESSLSPRPSLKKIESNSSSSKNATEGDDAATADTANSDDEKHSSSATIERQRMLKSQIKMYGDSKECVVHDSDPIALSRLMSRKLWPRTSSEFSLGLRVDAIDHRKHWFPGSVVEIMEGSATDNNMNSEEKQESNFTTSNNKAEPVLMVRVHFDNFCSKWDETYTIDDFKLGHVRPLYSHAVPKAPLEFMAYHRFQPQNDLQSSNRYNFFGLPFFLQFHNEWSTARAGAHILAQASRFILRNKNSLPVVTSNGKVEMSQHLNNVDVNVLYHQLADEARLVIAETINVLVESDKRHVLSILTSGNSSTSEEQPRPGSTENSPRSSGRRSVSGSASRSGASTSASLLKKLSVLIPKLPFDVRICDSESPLGSAQNVEITEETAYPFSLVRTIGNFMTARSSIVLQWKPISEVYSNLRSKKRNQRGSFPLANRSDYYPILYTQPTLSIHQRSQAILEGLKRSNSRLSRTSGNNSRRNITNNSHIKTASKDAKDMTLNVCLNEFCKDHCAEGWTCPKCGANGEGRQRMTLWNLPDLLTFHVKRFNCSARWREKISIKVNFPLTGLDMKEWCDPQSPVLQGPEDSSIYDLIGVINHLGGMTSGHYVAACKATYCGTEGGEELAYSFSGEGTNGLDEIEKETQVSSGWKLGRNKEKEIASSVQSKVATATAKSIAESHEPLWLQFDDDLVEPIPPSSVVSENAYVLFYRRRRISPSNVAKYNTID